MAGHAIDGRVLFPATGYLTIVWRTFAKLRGVEYEKLPVVLEDVQFQRATIMPKEGSVKFLINIFDGTGDFEICEGLSNHYLGLNTCFVFMPKVRLLNRFIVSF